MANSLRIDECKYPGEWNSFVRSHGTVHHLFEWSYVNQETFGCGCVNLGCWAGSELVAIYPYIVRGMWPLRWFVSPTDFGGGPIGDPSAVRRLMQEVHRRARRQLITMNVVRCCEANTHNLDELGYHITERRDLVVDINRPLEQIWESFPSKLRNSIKKSNSQGITVHEGGADDLDAYIDLVRNHSGKIGYRPRSEEFLRALFKHLDTTLLIATWQRHMVGGCLYINFNGRANAINAARDPDKAKLRIGEALHWAGITYCCEKGYSEYDFMSRNDNFVSNGKTHVYPSHASLHRFKKNWRPREVSAYDSEYVYFRTGLFARKLLAGLRNNIHSITSRLKNI